MIPKETKVLFLLALALCFALTLIPAPQREQRSLLEPFGAFAATIQWARADAAFDAGEVRNLLVCQRLLGRTCPKVVARSG